MAAAARRPRRGAAASCLTYCGENLATIANGNVSDRCPRLSVPQLASRTEGWAATAVRDARTARRGAKRPPPPAASFFNDSEGTGFLKIDFGSGHYKTLVIWAVMPPLAATWAPMRPASMAIRAAASVCIIASIFAIMVAAFVYHHNVFIIAPPTTTACTTPSASREVRLGMRPRDADARYSLDSAAADRPRRVRGSERRWQRRPPQERTDTKSYRRPKRT